jgi:hypothetical protein
MPEDLPPAPSIRKMVEERRRARRKHLRTKEQQEQGGQEKLLSNEQERTTSSSHEESEQAMPKRNHQSSSGPTPLLAQLLFQPIRDPAPPCQGVAHQDLQGPPQAGWEVRCYQDMDRLLALLQQGVEEAQATELLWQQTCQEQDRHGVRLHRRVFLCQDCAQGMHHRPARRTRPSHPGDADSPYQRPGLPAGHRSPHRAGRHRGPSA